MFRRFTTLFLAFGMLSGQASANWNNWDGTIPFTNIKLVGTSPCWKAAHPTNASDKSQKCPDQAIRKESVHSSTAKFWRKQKPIGGEYRSNGKTGKKFRKYKIDPKHQHIEEMNKRGDHLRTLDSETGDEIDRKGAKQGRTDKQ